MIFTANAFREALDNVYVYVCLEKERKRDKEYNNDNNNNNPYTKRFQRARERPLEPLNAKNMSQRQKKKKICPDSLFLFCFFIYFFILIPFKRRNYKGRPLQPGRVVVIRGQNMCSSHAPVNPSLAAVANVTFAHTFPYTCIEQYTHI